MLKVKVTRDRLSKERRSWNMSRIRGKDTSPELVVRKLLHRMGYRFRLHVRIPFETKEGFNRRQQGKRSQDLNGRALRKQRKGNSRSHGLTVSRSLRFVRPDIVLPKYKTVIFVHGCFWHRHRGLRTTL